MVPDGYARCFRVVLYRAGVQLELFGALDKCKGGVRRRTAFVNLVIDLVFSNRKNNLAKYLKGVTYELAREFGTYGVFVTCPTPDIAHEPEV